MYYYQHHIGDFDAATRHLSRVERSIYRDLIELYYSTESALSLDVSQLSRKVAARTEEEKAALIAILDEYFHETPTGWFHDRCEEELDKFRKITSQASMAGKASAAARAARRAAAMSGQTVDNSTTVERPLSYRTTDVVQNVNSVPTNHKPITINHELEIKALVPGVADDLLPRPAKPDCPHQEIIALYHEILPQCPAIRDWTPARQTQLRARWNESADRQSLDYWRGMFEYISQCDFLVGRSAKPFFADLEWITKSQNFTKIREGKYENR